MLTRFLALMFVATVAICGFAAAHVLASAAMPLSVSVSTAPAANPASTTAPASGPASTVYVKGVPSTITVKQSGDTVPAVLTILLPAIVGFFGALLGFWAATSGVNRQLTAQEEARRKNLVKEEALRGLDFDLEQIGRKRAALDALLNALTGLEGAVERFATQTTGRDGVVESDVATARTNGWGALYRLGYVVGSPLDEAVRQLLGDSWAEIRNAVTGHTPGAREVLNVLPRFRSQLRSTLKLVADELRKLDQDAGDAWDTARAGLVP